jgi:hypothetical protein
VLVSTKIVVRQTQFWALGERFRVLSQMAPFWFGLIRILPGRSGLLGASTNPKYFIGTVKFPLGDDLWRQLVGSQSTVQQDRMPGNILIDEQDHARKAWQQPNGRRFQ